MCSSDQPPSHLLSCWLSGSLHMAQKPQWGLHQLFRTQHSSLKETECLKYICDWKYLSVRPPAFFPFKVTVIEGWRHAILTFIIWPWKRSASFWMCFGGSGRGALRCHIKCLDIFRDALINNSFNLQYIIITPPPTLHCMKWQPLKK